jgi:hypothetical protein
MVEFHFLNIVLALQINGGHIFLRSEFKLKHHFGVIAKTNFFWDADVRITASQSSLRLQIVDGDWIMSHF